MNHLVRNYLIVFAVIAVLVLVAFYPTFANGFVCDDHLIVVHNPRIRSLRNIGTILTTSYWGDQDRRVSLYRPLTILSFATDYLIAGFTERGSLNPVVYHATNLVVHFLCSIAVYLLLRRHFVSPGVAVAASMLFAVHPVHADVVYGAVNRSDSFAALFFLIAFILYADWRRAGGERVTWRLVVSCLSFFIALGFKEMAITLPLALFLYDRLIPVDAVERKGRVDTSGTSSGEVALSDASGDVPLAAWDSRGRDAGVSSAGPVTVPAGKITPASFWHESARRYGGFILVIVIYVFLRFVFLGRLGTGLESFAATPILTRALTMCVVVGDYISALLFPVFLSADYPYNQWPVAFHTGMDVRVVISAVLVAVVFLSAALLARRGHKLEFFWLLFCLATLLPVLNIVPISIVKADRLLYLPSVGYCCLAALALSWLSLRSRAAAALSYAVVIAAFVVLCRGQGLSHRSDKHFAEHLSTVNPHFPFGHYLRARIFEERGARVREIGCYDAALELMPEYKNALHGRAIALYLSGDYVGAERDLRRLIDLPPVNPRVYFNLGHILTKQGRLREAVAQYSAALDAVDTALEEHFGSPFRLVRTFETFDDVERLTAALLVYAEEGTASNPIMPWEYARFLKERGLASYDLGEYELARQDLIGSIFLAPYDLQRPEERDAFVFVLTRIAECDFRTGRFGEAALDFKRLAELQPARAQEFLLREVECRLAAKDLTGAKEAAERFRKSGGELPDDLMKKMGR